jgi:hypothetical protein
MSKTSTTRLYPEYQFQSGSPEYVGTIDCVDWYRWPDGSGSGVCSLQSAEQPYNVVIRSAEEMKEMFPVTHERRGMREWRISQERYKQTFTLSLISRDTDANGKTVKQVVQEIRGLSGVSLRDLAITIIEESSL